MSDGVHIVMYMGSDYFIPEILRTRSTINAMKGLPLHFIIQLFNPTVKKETNDCFATEKERYHQQVRAMIKKISNSINTNPYSV